MKTGIYEMRIKIRREIAGVSVALAIIVGAVCAVLGIIFTVNGVNADAYECIVAPRFAPSLFILGLLSFVINFIYGFSGAVFAQSGCGCGKRKNGALLLSVCELILMYVLIPLAYGATLFFLSLLLCAVYSSGLCCLCAVTIR